MKETLELHGCSPPTDFYGNSVTREVSGCGRCFCGSHSRGRVHRRGAYFSRLEDEGLNNSSFSKESGRGTATGLIAPETNISIDSPFVRAALGGGLLISADSVEAESASLLEEGGVESVKGGR